MQSQRLNSQIGYLGQSLRLNLVTTQSGQNWSHLKWLGFQIPPLKGDEGLIDKPSRGTYSERTPKH